MEAVLGWLDAQVTPLPSEPVELSAAAGRVLAADGPTVHVIDGSSDKGLGRWSLPTPVRGLAVSRDGARLYAGGENELSWLNAISGELRGRARVDGITGVLSVN